MVSGGDFVISFTEANTAKSKEVGHSLSFFFFFLRAAPVAYGGSQARGRIGAVAASLLHSYSNSGSEPCL